MRLLRYLERNITLLNILLFAALGCIVVFVLIPVFNRKIEYKLPVAKEKAVEREDPQTQKPSAPSLLDYAVIADTNLYHPERRIPPEKKDEKPLPKPELVLYGTLVGGDIMQAFIEDEKAPKSTPGRGRRQSVVKLGDVLSGFVVKEIRTDRIILTRGQETMVVPLMDRGKQRGGETTGATTAPMRPSGSPPSNTPHRVPSVPTASHPVPAVPPHQSPPLSPKAPTQTGQTTQRNSAPPARPSGTTPMPPR
jgi:hypothetical protein